MKLNGKLANSNGSRLAGLGDAQRFKFRLPTLLLLRIVMLSLLLIAAATGCGRNKQASDGKSSPLRIGAILPLTGDAAFLGQEERKGIEAVLGILRESGIQVEVRYEDSRNAAREGLAAYQKLASIDSVQGMVVAHSGVCGPISEFLAAQGPNQNQYPVSIGTIVASTKITQNNGLFVRCYPSGMDEANAMAEYARQTLKIQTAAILYQNDDYGLDARDGFTARMSSLGGSVVKAIAFTKDSTDQRAVAAEAASVNPAAVYLAGNTPAFSACIRHLRENGYQGLILSGGGLSTENLRNAAGLEAVRDAIFTSTFTESDALRAVPQYLRFRDALQVAGTSPNLMNTYAAASLQILVDLLKENPKAKPEELARMSQGRSFPTVLGDIPFGPDRNAILPVAIKKVHAITPAQDELLDIYTPNR